MDDPRRTLGALQGGDQRMLPGYSGGHSRGAPCTLSELIFFLVE